MNRKQFSIVIGLVLAIGGLGLFMKSRREAGWQASGTGEGQKLLAGLQVNDVAQIAIKQFGGELTLIKKDDGWRVKERQDFPANFSNISEFLRKIADLKVTQNEKIGPSQLGRMELLPPGKGTNSGTLVEFRDSSGKAIKSLMLGKKYVKKSENPSAFGGEGFAAGRFVQDPENPQTVALISEPFANLEAKPADWLEKEFIKVEKVRALTLTSPVATNSWKLTRDADGGSEWKLADAMAGEKLDPAKSGGVAGALSSPSFVDVIATDATPEETGFDKATVIRAETFDGLTYTLKIGRQTTNENYYVALNLTAEPPKERTPGKDEKAEDRERLDKEFKEKSKQLAEKLAAEKKFEKYNYLVAKWTLDSLLKDRAQLLLEKNEEPKKDEKAPADK